MSDFFKNLTDLLSKFFNNENYISILGIFIAAFTTYRVTKYSALKPYRQNIKQSQLENVYLPLFRLLDKMPSDINKYSAITYNKKISHILDKNYLLSFPQLHRLNDTLKCEILTDKDYEKTLRIIRHQVCVDYELLKKSLGYPSENFFEIFSRMTKKQKLTCIFPWIDAFWLFIPALVSYVLKDFFGKYILLIAILLSLFGAFSVYKLKTFIDAMND